MATSINSAKKTAIFGKLKKANTAFQKIYSGDLPLRQPVHTLYGGANLFKHDSAKILAERALENFKTYAPDFLTFGRIFRLRGSTDISKSASPHFIKKTYEQLPKSEKRHHPAYLSYEVYYKVIKKLQTEAIEDFRIDFEDGFGNRSNEEEDATAMQAAKEVANGIKKKTLPPFIGIRIKPFT
ncbi:MAG: phosphoenolpyruvate kinase, partial [Ferruginibacter sp.]